MKLTTIIVFLTLAVAALGQPRTDRGLYPQGPTPPVPAKGVVFTDPVFGTEVLRVTDAADGPNLGTAYAYWPTFNADSTKMLAVGNNCPSKLVEFDPFNFRIGASRTFPRPAGDAYFSFENTVKWSGRNPDRLYAVHGTAIKYYSVAANQWFTVADLSSRFNPGDYGLQVSISEDDDVFGFTLKASNWQSIGYVIYKVSTGQLWKVLDPQLDEVQVDKSGRYASVATGLQGAGVIQTRIIDLQTGTVENLLDNGPDFAPGHGDYGTGINVAYDNWNNRITFRSLATPHIFSTVLQFNAWPMDFHLSLRADDERWGLVSTYDSGDVFKDELFLVATDGSQRVVRFLHHRSVWIGYYDSPRANLSKDGRFAAFTSNWGNSGRTDLYVAKVPRPDAAPTPNPTPTPSPSPSPTPTPTPTPTPAPACYGSGRQYSVSGKVYRKDGKTPLSGATVTFTDRYGNVYEAKTNKTGDYAIQNLIEGRTYVVAAEKPNFIFAPAEFATDTDRTGYDIRAANR